MSYILGENNLPQKTQSSNKNDICKKTLGLISLLLSSFFVTPMVIIFWASSWDILDYLPFSFLTNSLIYFCICNFILLNAYLWQEKIQSLHDKISCHTLSENKFLNYYGCDFLLRCVYTYILTTAYIIQWVYKYKSFKFLNEKFTFDF